MLGAIGAVVVGTVETTVVVETVGSSMVALVDSVVVSRPVKVIYTVLFFLPKKHWHLLLLPTF